MWLDVEFHEPWLAIVNGHADAGSHVEAHEALPHHGVLVREQQGPARVVAPHGHVDCGLAFDEFRLDQLDRDAVELVQRARQNPRNHLSVRQQPFAVLVVVTLGGDHRTCDVRRNLHANPLSSVGAPPGAREKDSTRGFLHFFPR